MKSLLAALLCLLFLSHAHGQAWPRNPATGKVEFQGTLPWPAGVKTEAQRKAAVRRWYLSKLTASTATEVKAQAATNQTNGLLTYAGLPKAVVLKYGQGDDAQLLSYFALLTPKATGLAYQLTSFNINRSVDVEAGIGTTLEQALENPAPGQQTALPALRKRLASAVAGW